jgi:hypothetical protein
MSKSTEPKKSDYKKNNNKIKGIVFLKISLVYTFAVSVSTI